MYQKDISFYLGKERETGFSGFIAEDNFFLVLEVEEGLEKGRGKEILKLIKEFFLKATITKLSDLEMAIVEQIKIHNLPAHISLAAGYVKDTILYLKTIGAGTIFLRRKNDFAKIIGDGQSASGYIQENDLFLFTTANFVDLFDEEKNLMKIFDHKDPHQFVEEITFFLKDKDNKGTVALFSQFKKKEDFEKESLSEPVFISQTKPWEKVLFTIRNIYQKTKLSSDSMEKKKTLTFILVTLIFFVFIWSVGLGYGRRKEANMQKKIKTTKVLIIEKLNQAEDSAFLNLPKALTLISEAKQEVNKLKGEVGDKRKEIDELNNLIKEKENKITKKEEKNYEEFFDLTVDNKDAQGRRCYLDVDQLSIIDKSHGMIYVLSLSKKSLAKDNFNEVKNAKLVALYNQEKFFYSEKEGIYKIDKEGKLKKIIEDDKEWGNIVDFWIYNGNLYLLDEGKNEIYKYLVTESGYSGKTSYFKGGAAGLKNANSMAIDSSVYVGFSDHIFKFTVGLQEEFKTSFPENNITINKIFTNKEVEKVYAWDKNRGSIYILGKNGNYEREINSSILSKADDFIVYGNVAYILAGAKIYKISLE